MICQPSVAEIKVSSSAVTYPWICSRMPACLWLYFRACCKVWCHCSAGYDFSCGNANDGGPRLSVSSNVLLGLKEMARIIGSNWLDYNFCIRLKPCTTCLLVAAERKLAVYAHACSSSFSIFQEERMKRIYFLPSRKQLKKPLGLPPSRTAANQLRSWATLQMTSTTSICPSGFFLPCWLPWDEYQEHPC